MVNLSDYSVIKDEKSHTTVIDDGICAVCHCGTGCCQDRRQLRDNRHRECSGRCRPRSTPASGERQYRARASHLRGPAADQACQPDDCAADGQAQVHGHRQWRQLLRKGQERDGYRQQGRRPHQVHRRQRQGPGD